MRWVIPCLDHELLCSCTLQWSVVLVQCWPKVRLSSHNLNPATVPSKALNPTHSSVKLHPKVRECLGVVYRLSPSRNMDGRWSWQTNPEWVWLAYSLTVLYLMEVFESFIIWVWAVAISTMQWFLSSWSKNDPETVKNKFTFRSAFAAALQLLHVWALMSNVFLLTNKVTDRWTDRQTDRQTDRAVCLTLYMQAQCVKGLNPVYKEREPQEPLQEMLWGCTCSCCYSQWTLLISCLPIYGLITFDNIKVLGTRIQYL